MMTDEEIYKNAFNKGLEAADKMQGKIGTVIRRELRQGLGNISPQALCYRANGNVKHTEFERNGIQHTFNKYGIKDPWGLV